MASEYQYDEGSDTWPYFVLALLVFFMVPLTIRWLLRAFLRSPRKPVTGAIPYTHNSMQLPNAAQIEKIRAKAQSPRFFNRSFFFITVGWAMVTYIWITYAKEVSLTGFFDPHTILDIPYAATDKEIKSRYRKLSLMYHPDKITKDISDKVREEMEAAFIQINLAYKALTDETTKRNLELYGHPDGQQEITHGVAIPKFLVEGHYSQLMIVFYFLLVGVVLPLVVGNWWNNVKATTKRGIHGDTAAGFVRHLVDKNPAIMLTPFSILDWMLESTEIRRICGDKSVESAKKLILSYLKRETVDEPELMLKLVAQLLPLIRGFIEIAVAFRIPDVVIVAYDLEKAIHQACSPVGKYRELLQLPFVDAKIVESQSVKKLGKLLTLLEEEAGKVLGITKPDQVTMALDVARNIPMIRVIDASFRVPGENTIVPNSSAHVVVKFLIKSAALKSCPEIDELLFDKEETLEDLKNPLFSNRLSTPLPTAFAPFFPGSVSSAWDGYLTNQSDNKFIENTKATPLSNVELTNLSLTQKLWIEGKEHVVARSTFKIVLPAPVPSAVGEYHFRLFLKNNAYFGCDVDIPVDMKVDTVPVDLQTVHKAARLEKQEGDSDLDSDIDSDLDISDPEEDSIAGALAALRGQDVKKNELTNGESDSESVFTDINTDTEDEGDE